MFQEEKPHLKQLPLSSFRYFDEGVRTVNDDTTIQIGHSSYAARPAPIGTQVLIRVYELEIEIRDLQTQTLIRSHPLSVRPGSVLLPNHERPFNPTRQTHFLMNKAEKIGQNTLLLCQTLFETQGRPGQKNMWGIMGVANKYPASIVEHACKIAIETNIRSSKQVRQIAEQLFEDAIVRLEKSEKKPHEETQNPLTQHHSLIRPVQEYGDLFNQSAQENLG